ncbi:unnamed protein product [Auanema sp. JU1783]|nr:unnamed protein product [Auanema sp. JU1783]
MRVIILLTLIGASIANDVTTCKSRCSDKYEETKIPLEACNFGCESRGSINEGFTAFVNCRVKCDDKYENSTDEDAACRYACSLPMSSSVFMTMDYSGKDGPKWKVVKQEGSIPSSFLNILRPSDVNGNLLDLKAPASQEDSSLEDSSDDFGPFNNHEMSTIQTQMDKLMQDFTNDFINRIRAHVAKNENIMVSRPQNHDPYAFGDSRVDNTAEDGSPIILTNPVSSDVGERRRGYYLEIRGSDHPRRWLATLHWALIAIGAAALFTTLLGGSLYLHNFRNSNYRRMRGDQFLPFFGRVQANAPPCPVKKTPEEWVENSKPSGVPPPAYDQVSIHEEKRSPQ